jgi:hypothetical protein
MIQRFTNQESKLSELYKPTLSIGTRMKSPRGILFRDYYYDDKIASLDDELLKPIEQKFARHYAEIVDMPWQNKIWPGDIGDAFVDWVAAQLCRTSFMMKMNEVLFRRENPMLAIAYDKDPQLANNIVRSELFQEYQDFLSRPLWKWKCRIFPEGADRNLVITDNPVCRVLGLGEATGALMVPLSKKSILFGGRREIVDNCEALSIRDINFCLTAWADRNIYAPDIQILQDIAADLSGKGIITGPVELLEAVRKPLFGLPERTATRIETGDVDVSKLWGQIKDNFGPSILDADRKGVNDSGK